MRSMLWRNSSMLKKRPIDRDRLMATTTASQGAWNTGSSGSRSTGPKPCMPPRSWTPFMRVPWCAWSTLAGHSPRRSEATAGPAPLPRGSQGHAVAERDPAERREDRSPLMKDHVRAEILDRGGDAVPEPLLVDDRCLTRLHLHEEVDVAAQEIVACSRPEEVSPRGGTEDLPHRGPDRLD